MDRGAQGRRSPRGSRALAAEGVAVLVATHDPEFAAAFAERAVLLADGRVIADAPPRELLAGGWYFATETARVLGGARRHADAAERSGAALLPSARRRAGARAR